MLCSSSDWGVRSVSTVPSLAPSGRPPVNTLSQAGYFPIGVETVNSFLTVLWLPDGAWAPGLRGHRAHDAVRPPELMRTDEMPLRSSEPMRRRSRR